MSPQQRESLLAIADSVDDGGEWTYRKEHAAFLRSLAEEPQLEDAYAEGRKDEREELTRLLAWSYRKLQPFNFSKQEDALMLDEINLILMGAQ